MNRPETDTQGPSRPQPEDSNDVPDRDVPFVSPSPFRTRERADWSPSAVRLRRPPGEALQRRAPSESQKARATTCSSAGR